MWEMLEPKQRQGTMSVLTSQKSTTFTTIVQFNYCTRVNKNVSQVKTKHRLLNKNNIQNGTTHVHFLQKVILQVFILGQLATL